MVAKGVMAIERLANDGYSLRSVLIPTKVVAAQPDNRRPYSGAPKFSYFHKKTVSLISSSVKFTLQVRQLYA
jgi:hypothetical protein